MVVCHHTQQTNKRINSIGQLSRAAYYQGKSKLPGSVFSVGIVLNVLVCCYKLMGVAGGFGIDWSKCDYLPMNRSELSVVRKSKMELVKREAVSL